MMSETQIWKTGGFIADDPWTIVDPQASPDNSEPNAKQLLPLADYLALPDSERNIDSVGVVLAPADDVSALEPHLEKLALIAVTFPAYSDGRGYSQASLLRSRLGYSNEIRAAGDVLIDQIPLMLRCGIDTFAVTNATALKRLAENRLPGIDSYYQPAAKPSASAGSYRWRHVVGSPA